MFIGSWKIDDLVTFTANTHTPSTGAATDADGAPAYRVYEDETSTPILTGTMALLDGSNTAGFYSEQITLSAANGFEKGKSYNIYISATVGGITGTMRHMLQVEAEVDANIVSDKTGYGLANNAITAAVIATDAVTEIQSGIATAAALTSAAGDITAILADTNELQGDWADGGRLDLIADAIKAKTDTLPADPADQSAVEAAITAAALDAAGVRTALGMASADLDTQLGALPTAVENADALLDRNMATGTDSGSATVRTVRQALRFLRNKWSISGSTLTVTKEDDTTAAWMATLTTDGSAEPVTGSDPASS